MHTTRAGGSLSRVYEDTGPDKSRQSGSTALFTLSISTKIENKVRVELGLPQMPTTHAYHKPKEGEAVVVELKMQLSDGYAALERVGNTWGLSSVGLLYWKPGYGGEDMKLSPVSRPRRRPRLSNPSADSFTYEAEEEGCSAIFFEPCSPCSSSEKTSCAERLCLSVVDGAVEVGVGRQMTLSSRSCTQRATGHVFYTNIRY